MSNTNACGLLPTRIYHTIIQTTDLIRISRCRDARNRSRSRLFRTSVRGR